VVPVEAFATSETVLVQAYSWLTSARIPSTEMNFSSGPGEMKLSGFLEDPFLEARHTIFLAHLCPRPGAGNVGQLMMHVIMLMLNAPVTRIGTAALSPTALMVWCVEGCYHYAKGGTHYLCDKSKAAFHCPILVCPCMTKSIRYLEDGIERIQDLSSARDHQIYPRF
jgi:hypothetical protein